MRRYSHVDPERARKVKRFILAVLNKRGLRLNKELDQHFVVDRVLLRKMVHAIEEIIEGNSVYEIGSGLGLLTRELARKRFVYAIDVDFNMLHIAKTDVLKDYENVELIGGDALEFYPPEGISLITGNIPYSISGPLIYRLMEDFGRPPAVLTVQKEFAEKLVAKPGTRAATSTSVLVHNVYEPEIVGIFPPESFFPPPKVYSAIVRLKPKEERCNYRILKRLTKLAFTSPNRKIKNTLGAIMELPKSLASKRPRQLTLDERCELVRIYLEEGGEEL